LRAVAGGAGGGWVMQHFGEPYLIGLCVALACLWFLVMLATAPVLSDLEQLPEA